MRFIVQFALVAVVVGSSSTTTRTFVSSDACRTHLDGVDVETAGLIDRMNQLSLTDAMEIQTYCELISTLKLKTVSFGDVREGLKALIAWHENQGGSTRDQFAMEFSSGCNFRISETTYSQFNQRSIEDILKYLKYQRDDKLISKLFCSMINLLQRTERILHGSKNDLYYSFKRVFEKISRKIALGAIEFLAIVDPARKFPRTFSRCGNQRALNMIETISMDRMSLVEEIAGRDLLPNQIESLCNDDESINLTSMLDDLNSLKTPALIIRCEEPIKEPLPEHMREIVQIVSLLPMTQETAENICSHMYDEYDAIRTALGIIEYILDKRIYLMNSRAGFVLPESKERVLLLAAKIPIIPVFVATFGRPRSGGVLSEEPTKSVCSRGPYDLIRESRESLAWKSLVALSEMPNLEKSDHDEICDFAESFEAGLDEKFQISRNFLFNHLKKEIEFKSKLIRTTATRLTCEAIWRQDTEDSVLDRIEDIVNNLGTKICFSVSLWNSYKLSNEEFFDGVFRRFPDGYRKHAQPDAYRIPRSTTVRSVCQSNLTRKTTIEVIDRIEDLAKVHGNKICKPVLAWNKDLKISDDQLFVSIDEETSTAAPVVTHGGWLRSTIRRAFGGRN